MKKYIFIIIFSFLMTNISPPHESNLNYTHVLFEWEQVEDAELYEIQIADSEDFENILTNTTSQSLIYVEKNILNWNTSYY